MTRVQPLTPTATWLRTGGAPHPSWLESIADWETHIRRISGSTVNRIEVGEDEVATLLKSRRPLWQAVRKEGVTLQGKPLVDFHVVARA